MICLAKKIKQQQPMKPRVRTCVYDRDVSSGAGLSVWPHYASGVSLLLNAAADEDDDDAQNHNASNHTANNHPDAIGRKRGTCCR